MELTPETVKSLIIGSNNTNKQTCIELAKQLKTHAYGLMPEALITERRPNESDTIKEYRKKIYVPITKRTVSKVISSLAKIRRSQDWNIQYNAQAQSSLIKDAETLERYCEYDYPHFTSVTNWTFSVLLRKYLLDANGIVAIVPERIPEKNNEYLRPVAMFFDSEQVIDYVEGEYVVLKSRDTTTYTSANGKQINNNGAIYYILTTTQMARYEQVSSEDMVQKGIYPHNIGALPAFKVGGVYHSRRNNETIYESRIAGMIPSLDEAAREYSDLQAEILQHIHSEKWVYANTDCPVCNGTGREFVKDKDGNDTGEQQVCHHCHGRGSIANVSPYGEFVVSHKGLLGTQGIPTPPIGYIQKNTDIAKFEDEHVRQHIYDALAAINMEFLAETPIAQSGVAKAYDKDEFNNFVNDIAEDIVRILDSVYFFINEYRYSVIVPDAAKRRAMLPTIQVPTKYDIVNTSTLMAELQGARAANVNPAILREMEIDYAQKQFCTNPEVAKVVTATFDLDPLFGISDDAKMTMKANGGITETDYIISCNIMAFVRRAVREHEDFYRLDYSKQTEIMRQYADEVKKQNEPINTPMFNDIDTDE